ncbi:MAG: cellulase family glycosylhydrolase [Actinomycetota bacterium]
MAVVAAHVHAASAEPPAVGKAAVPPPESVRPVVDIEVEAGLVGQQVTVGPDARASGGAFAHFPGPAQPPPPHGIRVAGNRLLRDGAPFVPVGFTMVALVHPIGEGETAWAARRFGPKTMEAVTAWGANTLRFQLSQRGLDPLDQFSSKVYIQRIEESVALARSYGLAVILSIQDQGPSGGKSHGQPTEATIRDWQTLTARFNGDQHVMYEIFNEPQNRPTADGWEVWRNGGPPERNQGTPAVGHQKVLEAIRATGATNVVIADAAQFGQRLDGIPLLHDPLGQVAYGVHPYLTHTLREPDDWEPGFGFLSSQFPVVATEWTAVPGVRFCKPEWATTSPLLVDFLQARDIGMLAWAFDVLDTITLDWDQVRPTSLEGFQCGKQFEHGPGSLLLAEMPQWRPNVSPCETGLSDAGVVALPFDVPQGGTYRLWSRVRPLSNGRDSAVPLVQLDDACPVPAWDTMASPATAWSWRTGPGAVFTLTPGRHTLRVLGGSGGVNLDRVILSADKPRSSPAPRGSR